MILSSEVVKIGAFGKPHGIHGEINFIFDNAIFDQVDCPYLVCKIEGLLVPFFIAKYRLRDKNTALFSFLDMDSEDKVLRLSGLDVYFPRKYYIEEEDEEQEDSWRFFVGYKIVDQHKHEIGIVDHIDDSTINILLVVKHDDKEILVPANEDFIISIDADNQILHMQLIAGLLEL